jgi:hypothetical protein
MSPATVRAGVSHDSYLELRRFAGRWPQAAWAVEGATGLGAVLTARLAADGVDVVDVPAKLPRRVRMLVNVIGAGQAQRSWCDQGVATPGSGRTGRRVCTARGRSVGRVNGKCPGPGTRKQLCKLRRLPGDGGNSHPCSEPT